MADTTTIDAEQRPEPDKPVRLNRKTVLTIGTTGIAVLFLGLNLGLRGFSKEVETPTGPINENLLATPKPSTADAEPDLRRCHAAEDSRSSADPGSDTARSRTASPNQHARSSGPSEEQLTAWSSPLFPPSAQALRQVQPPAPAGSALDAALAKLTDIKLPTPQDLFPGSQPSAAERNESFLATGANGDAYLQQSLQKPISPYEIKAGSIIPSRLDHRPQQRPSRPDRRPGHRAGLRHRDRPASPDPTRHERSSAATMPTSATARIGSRSSGTD